MNNSTGIWITGASSGIGRATAAELARVGCRVYASARRSVELERLNSELEKENHSIEIYPCNVASYQNVESVFKKISSAGKIDCLINNAGVTTFKLAEENSINEINDIITTNLLGSIYTIKTVLPHMIANGGGTIINILSVVAKAVYTKSTAYTASKMGLLGYANSLREEVREHNIRIINILPGATETPMWPGKLREIHGDKMMTSEDLARIIVWAYLQKGNAVAEEIVVRPITGDLK